MGGIQIERWYVINTTTITLETTDGKNSKKYTFCNAIISKFSLSTDSDQEMVSTFGGKMVIERPRVSFNGSINFNVLPEDSNGEANIFTSIFSTDEPEEASINRGVSSDLFNDLREVL